MSAPLPNAQPAPPAPPSKPRNRRRAGLAAALVALPLVAGITGFSLARTAPQTIAATPVAIAQLVPDTAASLKGRVAEIFGNKFVAQDETGRALVDLGRAGEGLNLVAVGDTVTVQGRFERGVLKANALIRADGSLAALDAGPKRGPGGGPGGPGRDPVGWARDKLGVAESVDVPAVEASLAGSGFTEIRVVGSGPKHLEMTAKDPSGRPQRLHVGFDGRIRKATPLT